MDMVAFADGRDDVADVLAVLDHRVADGEILSAILWPMGTSWLLRARNSLLSSVTTQSMSVPGGEVFDHHDADIVAAVVNQKLGYVCHGNPNRFS